VLQKWNPSTKKIDSTISKGFYAAREMSYGVSGTTRIFGLISFKKGGTVQSIRHEIRPSFGFSYHPDMNKKDHYDLQMDNTGKYFTRPSLYVGNINSAFGEGKYGSINFGLDNIVQMKVKNKKDTGEAAIRKVTLIDGLSINGGYNLLADSFKLSPLNLQFRTNLFEKINITAGGNIMPYVLNNVGGFADKLVWTKKPWSLGTLTTGSVAIQTSFKGGDKKEKLPTNNLTNPQQRDPSIPMDEYQQDAAYISKNPGEFANFNIPWSLSFSYSLNYTRIPNKELIPGANSVSQNISFNGTLNLTKKWQMGGSGYYNITTGELGGISMYLSREMHCWQMAINIAPVGKYRYFSINISPKSGVLRDLKINRTRSFYEL
jgi:hypothetical protein